MNGWIIAGFVYALIGMVTFWASTRDHYYDEFETIIGYLVGTLVGVPIIIWVTISVLRDSLEEPSNDPY